MPPAKDVTCQTCFGQGVIAGSRYTDPPSPCAECGGSGTVAKSDAKKPAEASGPDESA